jgi:hypothetical protein
MASANGGRRIARARTWFQVTSARGAAAARSAGSSVSRIAQA